MLRIIGWFVVILALAPMAMCTLAAGVAGVAVTGAIVQDMDQRDPYSPNYRGP